MSQIKRKEESQKWKNDRIKLNHHIYPYTDYAKFNEQDDSTSFILDFKKREKEKDNENGEKYNEDMKVGLILNNTIIVNGRKQKIRWAIGL